MRETIELWLNSVELNLEQQVHAGLVRYLADMFDSDQMTSTAAELRRAVNDLKKLIADGREVADPLAEILKR